MAKWHIYKDRAGEFRARLVANNGQNIVWSEGYTAKADARKAIEFVKTNAASAPVQDDT